MTGYELLTEEQRLEVDSLSEAQSHASTMRFGPLERVTLLGYEQLMDNLVKEYLKQAS